MKPAIVFGTRPEIIKLDPVIKEFEKRGINPTLIFTGQHNLLSLFKDLKIRQPDVILGRVAESVGRFRGNLVSGAVRAAAWSLRHVLKLRHHLSKIKPDALIYQGDTLAIACAAIAGKTLLRKPVLAHVEAGLRTSTLLKPFPEEIARRTADKLSDLLFAPTNLAAKNLRNARGKTIVTGNTIIDAVKMHLKLAKKPELNLPKHYAVAMVHRIENVHSRSCMEPFYNFLKSSDTKIILISHRTYMNQLSHYGLNKKIQALKNVQIVDLLDYLPFLKLLQNAEFAITDSGGIQEEVCALRKPCIVWRTETERPEAVQAGFARVVGFDDKLALQHIQEFGNKGPFYQSVKHAQNPFGDGHAAKRIVDAIEETLKRLS